MTVTVVVPTYNRRQFLGQALDSLLAQTLTADRILVVDDGSTDGTRDLVGDYAAVDYVRQDNAGKSAALNRALAEVDTDYVWFFDDDDVALPDALARLVEALDTHPSCGYSFGSSIRHEAEGLELGAAQGESWFPPFAEQAPFVALLEGCYLSGATLMARTECYRVIGGFDTRFRRSQDYHMALSLARRWPGVRVGGGPLFRYRQHRGVRGGPQHEVDTTEVWRNHHHHDAVMIRELYHQLPLGIYLPAGLSLDSHPRQAVLQRLSILLIHRVYPEVLSELRVLAGSPDLGPYDDAEHEVLERMVELSNGLATGDKQFARALRLSDGSPEVRRLRNTLLALLARRAAAGWRHPQRTVRLLWRSSWLMPGGLQLADWKGRAR